MAESLFSLNDNAIGELLKQSDLEDVDEDDDDLYSQNDEDNNSSEDDVPLSSLRAATNQSDGKWTKRFQGKNTSQAQESSSNGSLNPFKPKSPAEYFENYFDAELFEKFAICTAQYYMAEKGQQMRPQCTPNEIKKIFGVHGMMSCIKCPRMKMYWHQKFRYDPIANAMSRERFFMLRVNLHVVDPNRVDENERSANKLWKVQAVIDTVRKRCHALPRESPTYSVDEQMIPFTGRRAQRQYVANKPRPVGLKNFLVTTTQGLTLDFEIYQGPTTDLPDRSFGLGPAVVLRLTRTLPVGSLYFDRYFTTIGLLEELINRNFDGTGTIMANRFKKTWYTFKKDQAMKRGDCEEVCSPNGKLCTVKWKDNKSVLLASTIHGAGPSTTVSRWDKQTRTYKNIPCPSIVANYNNNMGGIDLCDQMIENYRTWFKTKKWTVKVIIHLFDLAIVNSWFEYREDARKANMRKNDVMDLLAFRISIVEYLLGGPTRTRTCDNLELAPIPTSSEYKPAILPTPDKRYDGYNHWPMFDTLKAPRKCRLPDCTSKTRARCSKCDVYLCITKDKNCFFKFHNAC